MDNAKDQERYWINAPPGPEAPEGVGFALVDDKRGREVAYFMDSLLAYKVCALMNAACMRQG